MYICVAKPRFTHFCPVEDEDSSEMIKDEDDEKVTLASRIPPDLVMEPPLVHLHPAFLVDFPPTDKDSIEQLEGPDDNGYYDDNGDDDDDDTISTIDSLCAGYMIKSGLRRVFVVDRNSPTSANEQDQNINRKLGVCDGR